MRRNLAILSALFCAISIFNFTAKAQDSEAATTSALTGTNLPGGAERLLPAKVPGEFNAALDKLIASGGSDVKRGKTEILAWTKNYKKSNAPNIIKQLTGNLQAAGWTYEAQENDDVTVFTAMTIAPTKRALVGLYTYSDEVLVVAWTEMLAAKNDAGVSQIPVKKSSADSNNTSNIQSRPTNAPSSTNASASVFDIPRDAPYVNVMGNELPPMPNFPALQPKPGRVRGYVKDLAGNPLKGATIGIRASYFAGSYSGAQGETDANGYYEFVVPKGSAHYYNAGYAIEWGDGLAAVGLHPADGKLESFVTTDGAVENFVFLPYGVTSRENLSQNPFVPSTYYGGSIRISYYTVSESDKGIAGSIIENSLVEITLTPEGKMLDGTAGKTFIIRQPIGFRGNFDIHNIPLGRYHITAKMNGKPLNMEQTRKFNPSFGMIPGKALGEASILFIPTDSKASMVTPNAGGWDRLSISVSTP